MTPVIRRRAPLPPAAAIVPLRSLDRAARDRDARAGVTHHHVDLSDAVTATDHVP
jgi:hypothetical protein